MKTVLSILMDNTSAKEGCLAEWGFSAALQLPNGRMWLWDAGQGNGFLQNGTRMGLSLSDAAGLALSHGHYDHTGGIQGLFEAGFNSPVLAHPDWTKERFCLDSRGNRSIGAPVPAIRAAEKTYMPVDKTSEIDRDLSMITDIKREQGNFQAVQGFFFDPEGMRPDKVRDDAALVFTSESGPVLLLGCCHSGLKNTLSAVKSRLGLERIYAVIGGLHLHNAPREAVLETAAVLDQFDVKKIHAGHCTGEGALRALPSLVKGEVRPLGSGMVLSF